MQRLKRTLKRIAAISSGAVMLGATIMAAAGAAELGTYPNQFVTSGTFNGEIVSPSVNDLMASFDVLAGLQAGTGDGVAGGVYKDAQLGKDLNNTAFFAGGDSSGDIDDGDIPSLWDGEITIDTNDLKKDYDTHEEILFKDYSSGGATSIETGLSFLKSEDEQFKEGVFLQVPKAGITYRYVFDDVLDVSGNWLPNASTTEPIYLNILGYNLRVTGASTSSQEITVVAGDYASLNVGDSVELGGKKITFLAADSNSALLDVDGTQEWITQAKTEEVNGIDIYVDKVHDIADSPDDIVEIYLSEKDAKKTYQNNDPFIDEPTSNPMWRWKLAGIASSRPNINVTFDYTWDQHDEVPYVGESVKLPNDYITIELTKLTQTAYRTYQVETTTEDLYEDTGSSDSATHSTAKVLHFTCVDPCGGQDSFKLRSSAKESDDIYVYHPNGTSLGIYYYDADSGRAILDENITMVSNWNPFNITYQDTILPIVVNASRTDTHPSGINWTFNESSPYAGDARALVLYTKNSSATEFTYLGQSDGDTTTANDWSYAVTFTGAPGSTFIKDIAGWEENTRTDAGIILHDPKAGASSDTFTLEIPEDISDFDTRVTVFGKGGGGSGQAISMSGATSDVIIKDATEADKAKNLILVGGPCVNELTATALGLTYPTCGEASGLKAGEAKIKVVEDAFGTGSVAVLAYGWEAEDTARAAGILRRYWENAAVLTGAEASV